MNQQKKKGRNMAYKHSSSIVIEDRDIATIESLHDYLLDQGVDINEPILVKSRELTQRMYRSLEIKEDE